MQLVSPDIQKWLQSLVRCVQCLYMKPCPLSHTLDLSGYATPATAIRVAERALDAYLEGPRNGRWLYAQFAEIGVFLRVIVFSTLSFSI